MIRTMQELMEAARRGEPCRMAVAAAQDAAVLQGVAAAVAAGVCTADLIGDETEIRRLLDENKLSPDGVRFVHEPDKEKACRLAAAMAGRGEAQVLMKGFVDTSVIMRAVLSKENGLRTGERITHDLLLEVPGFDRLLHVTDTAMTIAPDLEAKVSILRNAVSVAHALGNECPRVAVLCAVEKVNEKMPATVDAAALEEMNRRGEITGCVVQGPLAMDNAVSPEAAAHKGISGTVAGQADILLAPSIEAGNILGKTAEHFAGAKKAGVILGAAVPIALTSRSSSAESKLYTIALACLIAKEKERRHV